MTTLEVELVDLGRAGVGRTSERVVRLDEGDAQRGQDAARRSRPGPRRRPRTRDRSARTRPGSRSADVAQPGRDAQPSARRPHASLEDRVHTTGRRPIGRGPSSSRPRGRPRSATRRGSPATRTSAFMTSSAMPSQRYCWSWAGLMSDEGEDRDRDAAAGARGDRARPRGRLSPGGPALHVRPGESARGARVAVDGRSAARFSRQDARTRHGERGGQVRPRLGQRARRSRRIAEVARPAESRSNGRPAGRPSRRG